MRVDDRAGSRECSISGKALRDAFATRRGKSPVGTGETDARLAIGFHAPRVFHTATVLHSGFVLIHAGLAGDNPVGVFDTSTSELYDPGLNETVASNVSAVPRFWHTGTSLPDGSVLMAGGRQLYLDSGLDCLLFNPSTQAWTKPNGQLHTPRYLHTATELANGKVLVTGGQIAAGETLSSAEIYDPGTQAWTVTGDLNVARSAHTATLLLDGRVLVVGGWQTKGPTGISELYDPATGTWTPGQDFLYDRHGHTATRLQDGTVLIAGGQNLFAQTLQACLVFHPDSGVWNEVGNLNEARRDHTAGLLYTGDVMVTGGAQKNLEGSVTALKSVEFYNPLTAEWTLGADMNFPRYSHTQTVLPRPFFSEDIKVLVFGGRDDPDGTVPPKFDTRVVWSMELFTSGEVNRAAL